MKIIAALFMFILIGCSSTMRGAGSAGEAGKIVNDFTQKYGRVEAQDQTAPANLAEVVDIFKKDDVPRFESAVKYTTGLSGLDALSLRALLELSWGEIQIGVASLLDEFATQRKAEVLRLKTKKDNGVSWTPEEQGSLDKLEEEMQDLVQTADALRVLAKEHVSTGAVLAEETVRRFAQKPEGYRALAYAHLLKDEWKEFDKQMAKAEQLGDPESFSMLYLRALESVGRNVSREEGRALLSSLREKLPEYVRPQARLVFLQEDIEAKYKALLQLKEIRPQHPIVVIAGEIIEKEFQTAKALRALK